MNGEHLKGLLEKIKTVSDASELISIYEEILADTKVTDYLLDEMQGDLIVSKEIYLESSFMLGTLYKLFFEKQESFASLYTQQLFIKSIDKFYNIMRITTSDKRTESQLVSIYTQLCSKISSNYGTCLNYLKEILSIVPDNHILHYNLGFIYQRMNDISNSIIHYKLAIVLADNSDNGDSNTSKTNIKINSFNGVSCVYRSQRMWNEALYYLNKALELSPLDPDVNNQLGIVHTELRRTDLAKKCYEIALENYESSFISSNKTALLSDIYMNKGHMHSYNGDNYLSIECYNQALHEVPRYRLPFQNKLLNLCYIYPDTGMKYIVKQHKYINGLLDKADDETYNNLHLQECTGDPLIEIGIVSSDLIEHPVSFFISTFLQNFDSTLYSVTCYTENRLNTKSFPKIKTVITRGKSALEVAREIKSKNTKVLFDLAGHTAFNRIDVFALKPAPVQVSYIGYPFTTGLKEMTHRITDKNCDHPVFSKNNYTEKLLFMENCFLCYQGLKDFSPVLQKEAKEDYKGLVIGCFNRLNKFTPEFYKLLEYVLVNVDCTLVFKTKGLQNTETREKFLNKFSKKDRVKILNCSIIHEEHLLTYNLLDVSIDTIDYSGTTTSCESLFMGVPVFSKQDHKTWYHPRNVTSSILNNSGLGAYIYDTKETLVNKLNESLISKPIKKSIHDSFVYGKVCDQRLYMENFTKLIDGLLQE
jgi:tetratricopeptide (TPR) repeat protein